MKPIRVAVATTASLLAIVAALCAALARLDAESVRAALRERLEAAHAAQVEMGAAGLSLFPLPAVLVRDVRVTATPDLRIAAPELRIDMSLFDLLGGRITPTRVRARGATLEIGAVRLERVAWSGSLASSSDQTFDFTAESPVLGPIERGRLALGDAAGPISGWPWRASGELAAVDLARAAEALDLGDLRGRAAGRFEAAGRGALAESGTLALESGDVSLAGAQHRVSGAASFSADLGGAIAIDLTGANLRVGGGFEKPAGVALRLSGRRSQRDGVLRELKIDSQALRAAGTLDLAAETLDLDAGSLDLIGLSAWVVPEWVPRSGRVEIASARLEGRPLAVQAIGQLSDVLVALPLAAQVLATVSGRVATDGRQIRGEALHVTLAGEVFEAAGRYDWIEPHVELAMSARGLQFAPLAEALWGRSDLSGRLYGKLELAGPPDPLALGGYGDFELTDGQLPGLSLARAAGLGQSDDEETEPPGLDRFERLAARFEIARDRLEVREATLVGAYTTAAVSGQFYLRDATADLTGAVQFDHPLVPVSTTRPILRMAGRLDALATHISDAQTDDVRKMEASMIEAIRKVEAERRAGRG
jgi:AsmA-like C-terminal region